MKAPAPYRDKPWLGNSGTAIIHEGRTFGYQSLISLVDARAASLASQGLGPGQVVLAPDSPGLDLVLMQFALARIGAALFPFRSGQDSEELRSLAKLAGVEWVWESGSGRLLRTDIGVPMCSDLASAPIALLIRTSGSKGTPKAAMLTSENLLASASRVNVRLGLGQDDIWLCCLRSSHIGGISIGYRCALAGATLLLHEGFDVLAVRHDLDVRSVTHLSLVPPMLARLLDLNPTPPRSLRVLLVGGQALSPSLVQRAVAFGWPLHVTYGMTETASQIATTKRLTASDRNPGDVGDLLPEVRVDVQDCGCPPRPLRVCGPIVMAGYANPERRVGVGLDQGWFQSADLACLAPYGRLRILGRADDVLVIGGQNVSLVKVERILDEAPGVREILVVGIADPVWGHRLVAVFSGEAKEGVLASWCGERLRGPECPRSFLRLGQLPLLDSGKHDRLRITAMAERLAHCQAPRSLG